jgi:hypothetical protein
VCAGVYTLWDSQRFIYVGMAGRSLSAEGAVGRAERRIVHRPLFQNRKSRIWWSGDQFCVYLVDSSARLSVSQLMGSQWPRPHANPASSAPGNLRRIAVRAKQKAADLYTLGRFSC